MPVGFLPGTNFAIHVRHQGHFWPQSIYHFRLTEALLVMATVQLDPMSMLYNFIIYTYIFTKTNKTFACRSYRKKLCVKSNTNSLDRCCKEAPETATIPLYPKSSACNELSPLNAWSCRTSIWLCRKDNVIRCGNPFSAAFWMLVKRLRSKFNISRAPNVGSVCRVSGPLIEFDLRSNSLCARD